MTVAELIEELQKYPADLKVVYEGVHLENGGYHCDIEIRLRQPKEEPNDEEQAVLAIGGW